MTRRLLPPLPAADRQVLFLFAVFVLVLFMEVARAYAGEAGGENAIRRFAFVVGANHGGRDRVTLQYAQTDAKAFARVLTELGGLSSRDIYILLEPNRNNLATSFSQMQNLLQEAKRGGQRIEFVFYYSGHSDEGGLLLANESYSYRDLRRNIEAIPADVRIAVLDSCSSGALTRRKGGQRRAAFLVDDSAQVKGNAYLTSSAATEGAQESDRIGGSFFTHYLISGLRGAADANQDGRVTINEAYNYAFNETLRQTESTSAGPQHPNYDFQLAGSGDLVLTDLRETSSGLVLGAAIDGRVYIRDAAGRLVAEISKPGGREMTIALEPGKYVVTYVQPEQWRRGAVTLSAGRSTALQTDQLAKINPDRSTVRGNPAPAAESENEELTVRDVAVSLFPAVSTNIGAKPPVKNYFSLNATFDWNAYLSGVEASGLGAVRLREVKGSMISGLFNYVGGPASGCQVAGVVDLINQDLTGAQFAGVAAYAGGNAVGAQGAGLAAINLSAINGLQAGGLFAYAGEVDGAQGAGVFAIARRNAQVLQGAGVASYTGGEFYGMQGSTIVNIAGGSMRGAQLTVVGNYAGSLTGLQAGLLNIVPSEATGAQLGLLNYATKLRGASVGLINISPEVDGEELGLFSYAGNGILAPTIWFSDGSLLNVGLKMGSKHIYGLYALGVHPVGGEQWLAPTLGLGVHGAVAPAWYLDADVSAAQLISDRPNSDELDLLSMFRLMAGYRFNDAFSIYFGPTLNCLVSAARDRAGLFHGNLYEDDWRERPDDDSDGKKIKGHTVVYPGAVLGFQFEPQLGKLNSH